MNRPNVGRRRWWITAAIFALLTALNAYATGLEWDALEKNYSAKENEEEIALAFSVSASRRISYAGRPVFTTHRIGTFVFRFASVNCASRSSNTSTNSDWTDFLWADSRNPWP